MNSPGRQLGRVDLLERDRAGVSMCGSRSIAQLLAPRQQRVCGLSSNRNSAARCAALGGRGRELGGQRRLAGARRRRRSACSCPPRCRRRAARRARRYRWPASRVVGRCRCSAATRRGNTWMPPVLDRRSRGSRRGTRRPRYFTTRSRRRSAPYSGFSCSSRTTPWAMLCICRSWSVAVMSSSSSTVQSRVAKNCLSARICRR